MRTRDTYITGLFGLMLLLLPGFSLFAPGHSVMREMVLWSVALADYFVGACIGVCRDLVRMWGDDMV